MQVTHLIMLYATLAAAQLSKPGEDGTSSGDNALTAKAEAEGGVPVATTPSSLPTDYSLLNSISEADPTVMTEPNTAGETPTPNGSPDPVTDLPVGSTGIDDKELEGRSPEYLVSSRPAAAAAEPVQPETAPPEEATVQDLEQAASPIPPTESTGVFTSDSPPGSLIASSTPVVASVSSDDTLVETSSTVTPIPSPAEATAAAAILAVPNSISSQGLETQSPSISTPVTAATETGTIPAPPSTTFLSVISSSSSSDPVSLGFIAIATNSSSSFSFTSPSPTDSVPAFIALATDSSSSLSSPSPSFSSSASSSSSTTTTTNTPAMASTTNTSVDASLDTSPNNTKSSSNEYLSSQAKVAIALVSVVSALAIMAVIGYVLWHMRMRDARLRRNQAALARGIGSASGSDAGNAAGKEKEEKNTGVGKRRAGQMGHKRNLSVEEKMKQALEKDHDVPLDIAKLQSQSHSEAQDGPGKEGGKTRKAAAKATVNNRFSKFSTISENSEEASGDSSRPGTQSSEKSGSSSQASSYGNKETLAVMASTMAMGSEESIATATASEKEVGGVGYGLGRSESLESEESHYSEEGQDRFGRTETLEVQRGRYVHERSESLRSQWSDVEEYYGIERFETDVPGPENGLANDAGTGAEALESEETLVRTESGASTASGQSGLTVGKAL